MKNRLTFTISIVSLCLILLACNFTGGAKSDDEKPVVKTEKDSGKKSGKKKSSVQIDESDESENSEETTVLGKGEFKKLEIWECNFTKMGHVVIPGELSREELVEVAEKIHRDQWETLLFLIDDEAGAKNHIRYMKQMCKGEADKSTFPHDWADRHIIATIMRGKDASWDLYEGSQKDGWLENDFDEKDKTKIIDLYYSQ